MIWDDNIDKTGSLNGVVLQQCTPDRITVVADPTGLSRRVVKMTVYDTDVAPCTPTENPRAQLLSPRILEIGKDYWIGFSVLVPKDFPNLRDRQGWVAINSIYGPPYAGSSGNGYDLEQDFPDGQWYFSADTSEGKTWWKQAVPKGKWVDFVVHYQVDTQANGGYREQWTNVGSGWKRSTFSDGSTRYFYDVISSANNSGPNESKVVLYYSRGAFDQASLYFASHKVGTSFSAVAPRSY